MKKNSNWNLLWDPFTRIAGWQAFWIGIVVVIISTILAHFGGLLFDGAMDTHFGIPTTMTESLIVMGVSLLTVVLVMYVTGLIIAKNFRFIDILGTMTLARVPFLILAILSLFTTFPEVEDIMRDPMIFLDYPSTILFMVIAVPLIVWYIALLYNGFKVSTGAKGAKLIIGFVVGVLVAEAISKLVLIFWVLRHYEIFPFGM